MLNKTSVALAVSLLLSGCISTGPTPICTPDTSVPIANAEVPTKNSDDRKVIILPVEMEFKDVANDKIRSIVRSSLESQVIATGTELVDRKLANKLKKEITLAEQSGRYNSKGVPIADYAVLTEVTSVDFKKSFSEESTYKNKKGELIYIPASCHFSVDVSAVAKVVSLPDMALVERIELKGDDSVSTETRNSSCPISDAGYQGIASKAAAEAVEYSRSLKTLLAAKAQVLELRQCESGSMVKIGIGADRNVKANDSVAFSKIIKNSEGELETFSVGEGEVIDNPQHGIKAKYSWVTIEEETALKIRKGDAAQIVPKACKSLLDLECQGQELMNKAGL
ncbi:hypothetical protein ATY37_13840 [Vibrio cidicii]|uniref:Curli production assembly/transport component CsgG n=1 Tax=Vibrio cidicii TaxID=1763883 RepID=A0A151KYX0_9VIBR|nr:MULTISPECIES: hypothetical protein [Vibrio]EJN6828665.1 hypothetical protein [Vibrio cidicii]ELV8626720.1 hypothetical protein [Vibrio cidicii]KGK15555.1 hypothetical protein EA24_06970 [Vibrio navarrensis]KYN80550.1 hypothetical protein ATY36_18135 [Vibrio cidicii]KYN89008.1 hypothetical protein ATY37_13840 [Vibrio cidicii]